MSALRVGSLCTGYGGLELAAEHIFGPLERVWHAEIDPAASAVLAKHWPDVQNLGDISVVTAANAWADQAPIDILLAGYPCQGESNAGLRRGADDPRFRWPDVYTAVRALRPGLVVLENVRGHLNRSFPRVVADLAGIGYVGRWRCVRASDVGAAHRRERLFAVAWPADASPPRISGAGSGLHNGALTLLPTPSARDGRRGAGWGDRPGRPLSGTVHRLLLPTPRATDGTNGGPNQRWRNGDLALSSAVQSHHLLPTPTVADARNTRNATAGRSDGAVFNTGWTLCDVAHADRWGVYSPAIARWEALLGRPAPEPTIEGRRGSQLLSPLFVEWLMGLPAGWVTDVIGHRGSALRILGNGVVPQAGAHALRLLLAELHEVVEAVAA